MIALIVLILIGVAAYQNQKIYEKHKENDEKIADDIDSIIGCVQLIVRQNDSILNYQQDQLRIIIVPKF